MKIFLKKIFIWPLWKNKSIFPFLEYKSVLSTFFSIFKNSEKLADLRMNLTFENQKHDFRWNGP